MSDELKKEEECLDFDSEINDDQEDDTLPEGDYNFYIEKMERGAFPGSEKIPPCNKVRLTMRVQNGNDIRHVWVDLILHSTLEWKLSSFFRSIGQKKRGEKLKMDWSKVEGAVGRARFKPRTYTNKNGEERTVDNLAYFIDWDPKFTENYEDFAEIPASEDSDFPF